MERRCTIGVWAVFFRIRGRGTGFARLKNDEAGVDGVGVGVEEVFPITVHRLRQVDFV
jgi:hypothetical protein